MKRLCVSIVLLAWASLGVADEPPYPDVEWETYSAISGVGEITQTYPAPDVPNRRNLHYGGTGSPESASFEVDVANAHDNDRLAVYKLNSCGDEWIFDYWDYEDAGVSSYREGQNNWVCSPAAGTMSQGGFSSTFTPGNGVYSGITITCYVYEGTWYSYEDGNYDALVTKTWSSLNTFKVTLYLQPGNKVYAEDDANATRQLGGVTNSALDLGTIGWTGITSQPGATPNPALSGEISKSITWTTRCETDTGAVGGIMGSVSFGPYINCNGQFHAASTSAGLLPPGTDVGNVAAAFAASYNPYAGAAVLFSTWVMGSRPHTNYGLIGESIIQNGSGTPPRINFSDSVTDTGSTSVDLSSLSTSQGQSSSLPVFVVSGSINIKSKLQCNDGSIISEITGFLKTLPSSPVACGTTTWGSSRPGYGG